MSILSALLGSGKVHTFEQAFGVKDITSSAMNTAIRDWFDLYFGLNTPKDEDPCQRIPVTVVNKLTKTAFSEFDAAPAKNSGGSDYVANIIAGLGKVRKQGMQQALIGGVAYLKPLLHVNGGIDFNVVSRLNLLVLARDDTGRVTSAGTAERTKEGKAIYTLLERRSVDANGYLTLENKLFISYSEELLGVEIPLASLERYARLVPEFTYPLPVWSLGLIPVRTPLENCVDGSPDPVSVFAPAVGLIHNINRNEAQLNGEFERGKSRLIVSDDMLRQDKNGQKRLTDEVFVGLDDDPDAVGVTIFSPALREASYLARKTEYLRNVETVIGLKRGLLSEVEAAERTATEVTSSAGDYNLTIIDFQQMWETAVREAVRVCDVLGRMYKVYSGPEIDPEKDVTISWGNGILYDEDKTWEDYKAMVAAGLLKPEIAVGWYFDLPTDTEKDLQLIRSRYMPEMEQLLDDDGGDE